MTGPTAEDPFALVVDQRRPLPDLVEEKLRRLIESGQLTAGERLPTETDLAARMDVARGSLRTALQRLEALRVLEVRRGLGWFVLGREPNSNPFHDWISEKRIQVRELLEFRMPMEALAASLAAKRATESEKQELIKLNQEHRFAGDDLDELVRTDEAFHGAIIRAARNGLLAASYEMLVPELAEWRRQSFATPRSSVSSSNEHDTILFFLERSDPAGARVAMTTHVLSLYNEVVEEPAPLAHFG